MTPHSILITGARGLIGTATRHALRDAGYRILEFDIAATEAARGDVHDSKALAKALREVDGVLHLAAVSRVLWGERDPRLCLSTNVDGTRNVLDAALASPSRPWVLLASSREVYGQSEILPVTEDAPLRPVNVYGRSKAAGEELVLGARMHGLCTAVVRLSNVYGSTADHADRVVPAFVRAAARGAPLRVDGPDNLFDFTFVDDVARGLVAMIGPLSNGETLPPMHLVTGEGTTLGALARVAVELAASHSVAVTSPSRHYDVARFLGDPSRARALLGWEARVPLREGVSRLLHDVRKEALR